jgi:hypothetical protein
MDVERRIKAREREAERRAKALERRIKAGERKADARRKAYEDEMRAVEGEEVGGIIPQRHEIEQSREQRLLESNNEEKQ